MSWVRAFPSLPHTQIHMQTHLDILRHTHTHTLSLSLPCRSEQRHGTCHFHTTLLVFFHWDCCDIQGLLHKVCTLTSARVCVYQVQCETLFSANHCGTLSYQAVGCVCVCVCARALQLGNGNQGDLCADIVGVCAVWRRGHCGHAAAFFRFDRRERERERVCVCVCVCLRGTQCTSCLVSLSLLTGVEGAVMGVGALLAGFSTEACTVVWTTSQLQRKRMRALAQESLATK